MDGEEQLFRIRGAAGVHDEKTIKIEFGEQIVAARVATCRAETVEIEFIVADLEAE